MVKKVPMTHLKTVSAGNDTSTNIRESKRPGKRSGRLAERPNKRSIANNQNGYESLLSHSNNVTPQTTHDNHMNAVAAWHKLRTIL